MEKPSFLTTDAINYAIGAVLEHEFDDKRLLIAYASRKLNPSEVRYSTIKKEALACLFGVTHFNYYLVGDKLILIMNHTLEIPNDYQIS